MNETLWSNQACFGYCIKAAEAAGVEPAIIREIVRKMHRMQDDVSVAEAARIYRESDY